MKAYQFDCELTPVLRSVQPVLVNTANGERYGKFKPDMKNPPRTLQSGPYTLSLKNVTIDSSGQEDSTIEKVSYKMPPIVAPYENEPEVFQSFLGIKEPLFEAPPWMNGVNAGRKFNTVIRSLLSGLILYAVLRLAVRKPPGQAIHPVLDGIDENDLDEITYKAIAIGFPIFTLGALIFARIRAQVAWGRFRDWDPKEVWALVTWLFYSAYLHLRLARGWQGRKSAWLAVLFFWL